MNRMDFERIMNAAAMKAAEGTVYDWTDLLDNTQQYERKAKNMNESEMYDYWLGIFKDSIAALEWSDEDSLAGTGLEHGQKYDDPTGTWMILRANGDTIVTKSVDGSTNCLVNVDIDEVKYYIAHPEEV